MVTVVTRPQGHKIIDQSIEATITETYGGDAIVTFPAHGLTTGDYVYITSDIDEYNGFWYVTTASVNTFKISEGATTDFVEYYQDADIEYYQTQEHDWSSIFLPIVYKCQNDRWPTNTVDSATLILINADDNGFTELTTLGPIKANINALEFLKISNAPSPEANGVWQIVEVVLSNVYVINLPYELSGNLIGATVQYYYNNYQVKVKIFAGLPPLHPWYDKKPYAEVAELSLTPDEDNQVMFSISDYIKMKVAIRNNLTLYSLPLNLDAFTGFYISTAESYDDSDNYSLTTTESSFEIDTFQGYAIAGKLPFKNIYSGDYADYILTSGSPARWLTNHSRLLAVEGYFFDISFIKNIAGDFQIIIDKYVGDYAITETIDYVDQGIGVYRIPITPDANYDSFCVRAYSVGTPSSGGGETPVGDFPDISAFTNVGTGDPWTTGANPFVNVVSGSSLLLRSPSYAFDLGITYKIVVEYTKVYNSGAGSTHEIALRATDNANAPDFQTIQDTTAGSEVNTIELEFTPLDPTTTRINIEVDDESDVTITIDSFAITTVSPVIPGTPAQTLTEEICIDILETCESIEQFTQTARRLLEDGGYRLLE